MMRADIRRLLSAARARLDAIDAYEWRTVETWAASVRPMLVATLKDHVEGFDDVVRAPSWCASPMFSSTDIYGNETNNFAEAAQTDREMNRKIAASAHARIGAFLDALLALPDGVPSPAPKNIVVHNYGETQMGNKYETRIENSTVGAAAIGANAVATGIVGGDARPSQQQHRQLITDAQRALVSDQDALDNLDARLFEALNQFLRIARDIQVEQHSLAELQKKMKDTLDEVWAEQVAKGLKPQVLPTTLAVGETLLKSPLMLEAVKKLFGL